MVILLQFQSSLRVSGCLVLRRISEREKERESERERVYRRGRKQEGLDVDQISRRSDPRALVSPRVAERFVCQVTLRPFALIRAPTPKSFVSAAFWNRWLSLSQPPPQSLQRALLTHTIHSFKPFPPIHGTYACVHLYAHCRVR